MGSSRDWAAKGVSLLGVRAVLALSFERIHRWNLIGMGILPLRLPAEWGPSGLALQPGDLVEVEAEEASIAPRSSLRISIKRRNGQTTSLQATAAIETSTEVNILRAGGILPLILRNALETSRKRAVV